MQLLYAELSRWTTLPFEWGQTDCALAPADWVRLARGLDFDPAAELRGTYASRAECYRVTGWHRDPIAVVERLAAPVGLLRAKTAVPGDIGIVMVQTRPGQIGAAGAVKTASADHWAVRCEGKMPVWQGTPAGVVAVWGVGYAA